ncbi:hypothetical protein ELH40_10465 [Rhizobium ruizarguesonis]|uniref:Uncharacterized protein n=1 Tax=Rhizobium ruizarguesonis TaxID=2081791 RepID=A0AB38I3W4_9HYPH|nr:hypothetical protein ELH40_10465 [Rhizobium ruizarguesonis]
MFQRNPGRKTAAHFCWTCSRSRMTSSETAHVPASRFKATVSLPRVRGQSRTCHGGGRGAGVRP